jgi:hypothetical protein
MEGFSMRSACDQKTGHALCERAREAGCRLGEAPISAPVPLTLGETLEWARRIPRSARVAQGFTRIADFARKVKQLRGERAALRRQHPDPLRRAILDTLDRVLADRSNLVIAARREAGFWWNPRVNVWWGVGKPRTYDSVRVRYGRCYPKRDVAVPAAWLLARLDDVAPNVAIRVRQADPRPRILSTPHWIERVATGVLACPDSWLTAGERAEVADRAAVIRRLQWERSARKLAPEFRVGDIHVGPTRPGSDIRVRGIYVGPTRPGLDIYVLALSGECVHCWYYWPTRAEIVATVRQVRKQRAQERARAPSPDAPDTLGWRGWRWDGSLLISPVQGTPWHDTTLRAEKWSDSAALRGQVGVHACRMPCDWRRADPSLTEIGRCNVHGVVERFGRYVLGTAGWRAEWVAIRELQAPDVETALALLRRYPDVRVQVMEQEASHEDR